MSDDSEDIWKSLKIERKRLTNALARIEILERAFYGPTAKPGGDCIGTRVDKLERCVETPLWFWERPLVGHGGLS